MKTIQISGTNRSRSLANITVSNIALNQFKPNRQSAQLRQECIDHYPSGRPDTDLFGAEEYGFEAKDYTSTRVAFIDAPLGVTAEQVQAKLNALVASGKFPTIQRVMSLNPILSDEHKAAIAAGLTTVEKIAASQLAKKQLEGVDENGKTRTEDLNYNGHKFYRIHKFVTDYVEDIDLRPAELSQLNGVTVAEAQVTKVGAL